MRSSASRFTFLFAQHFYFCRKKGKILNLEISMKSREDGQKSQTHKRDGPARSIFSLSKRLESTHRQNADRDGAQSNHVASLSRRVAAKREENYRQETKKSIKENSSVVELFGMLGDLGRVATNSVEVK